MNIAICAKDATKISDYVKKDVPNGVIILPIVNITDDIELCVLKHINLDRIVIVNNIFSKKSVSRISEELNVLKSYKENTYHDAEIILMDLGELKDLFIEKFGRDTDCRYIKVPKINISDIMSIVKGQDVKSATNLVSIDNTSNLLDALKSGEEANEAKKAKDQVKADLLKRKEEATKSSRKAITSQLKSIGLEEIVNKEQCSAEVRLDISNFLEDEDKEDAVATEPKYPSKITTKEEITKKVTNKNKFSHLNTSILVTGDRRSGKTTAAKTLAETLSKQGLTTLLVDLDLVRRNLSYCYPTLTEIGEHRLGVFNVLRNPTRISDSIICINEYYDFLGTAPNLNAREETWIKETREKISTGEDEELDMVDSLRFISDLNSYDIVVYDCPFELILDEPRLLSVTSKLLWVSGGTVSSINDTFKILDGNMFEKDRDNALFLGKISVAINNSFGSKVIKEWNNFFKAMGEDDLHKIGDKLIGIFPRIVNYDAIFWYEELQDDVSLFTMTVLENMYHRE